MRTLTHFFTILLVFATMSCTDNTTSNAPLVASNVDFAVEGMVCSFGCAKAIEEHVSDLDGIMACKVDFETKKAHIEFDNSKMSGADIAKVIESLNNNQYKVSILKEEDEANEGSNDGGQDEEEEGASKKEPVSVEEKSFSFPDIVTYFLNGYR